MVKSGKAPMNALILGSGAREHALGWKIKESNHLRKLFFAPGNSGTARLGINVNLNLENFTEVADWAEKNQIALTVVGPENPLADGIVNHFQSRGLLIFGPTKEAARLEASKAWAKEFMQKHGVPTANAQPFDALEPLKNYLQTQPFPIVLKADGLAAGKGVAICATLHDAISTAESFMKEKTLGEAGKKILVEEYLEGEEISAFALIDGKRICYVGEARDYKRANDGDQGPNTGGMGAVSFPELIDDATRRDIRETIFERALAGLLKEKIVYQGLLYAGLMRTKQGLKVLEFNVRFGDPETQVVLPRMNDDLFILLMETAKGNLSKSNVSMKNEAAIGVVIAAEGYPGTIAKGLPLPALQNLPNDILAFYASTSKLNGMDVNGGGRTLTVVSHGESLGLARTNLYNFIGKEKWNRYFYRKDIGENFVSLQTR